MKIMGQVDELIAQNTTLAQQPVVAVTEDVYYKED